KWGGPWCNTLRHYGTRTTQRAESAHSALKTNIPKKMSVITLLEKIKQRFIKENASYMSQKATEQRTNPVSIFNQPLFKNLLGRISHFALVLMVKEFKNQKDNKHDDPACTCAISRNFGLPCRHLFPEVLVPDQIDQFWHLDCEKEGMPDFRNHSEIKT
ncbi:hypothetical protein, partial, partial [Absidia glauca]